MNEPILDISGISFIVTSAHVFTFSTRNDVERSESE